MMTRKVIAARIHTHHDMSLGALQAVEQRADHQAVGLEHVGGEDVAGSG